MSKKIAFIRRGRVPLVSEKIAAELQKKFPRYQVATEKYTWANTGDLMEENIDWMLEKLKMKSVTFTRSSPELKALRLAYKAAHSK